MVSYDTDGSATDAVTQPGCWRPGTVTTMATPKQKLWKLQLFIEFPAIFLSILKSFEHKKSKFST
jgi:hypothetical protein